MSPAKRALALAATALFALSCNLFNPGGEGDVGGENAADALILHGQEDLKARRFDDAYEQFSAALRIDSSRSLAWHGLAKAAAGRDSLPLTEIMKEFVHMSDTGGAKGCGGLPQFSDSLKTRMFRPTMAMREIYREYQRRDSLGLLDGAIPFRRVLSDQLLATSAAVVLKTSDFNHDGIFDERDSIMRGMLCLDGKANVLDSSFKVETFVDSSGAVDQQKVDDFNRLVEGSDTLLEDIKSLTDMLGNSNGSGGAGDTTTENLTEKIDSFIQSAGQSIRFYKMSNLIDDDGDGCRDEEVYDGQDNDGDGFVDEDFRVGIANPLARSPSGSFVAGQPAIVTPEDSILNDRDSGKGLDDAASSLAYAGGSTGRLKPFAENRVPAPIDFVLPLDLVASDEKIGRDSLILRRVRVLDTQDPAERKRLGKTLVKGCW